MSVMACSRLVSRSSLLFEKQDCGFRRQKIATRCFHISLGYNGQFCQQQLDWVTLKVLAVEGHFKEPSTSVSNFSSVFPSLKLCNREKVNFRFANKASAAQTSEV